MSLKVAKVVLSKVIGSLLSAEFESTPFKTRTPADALSLSSKTIFESCVSESTCTSALKLGLPEVKTDLTSAKECSKTLLIVKSVAPSVTFPVLSEAVILLPTLNVPDTLVRITLSHLNTQEPWLR